MRILTVGNLYPPHHLGGYEITWRSSVEHLRDRGHEVRVLTTDYRSPSADPRTAEDADVHRELRWYWRDHDFPRISLRERVALERHNAGVLERHLRDLRPDAVCWWGMGGMSMSLIERVRLAGTPATGVVGDVWMTYGPKVDAWSRLCRRLGPLGRLLGRAAGVPAGVDLSGITWLFNSDSTLRRTREEGVRLEYAEVAHPGVDGEVFRPAPEHEWRWRLLHVGRIDRRKGIDAAVDALAALPGEATLKVLGAGDDRYLEELHRLCERLGVERRVEFGVLPREELPAAYAEADALLFPVRWEEPWGLVPLEAMSVGTPVVATGTGGSAEYLRDGENALLVGEGAGPGDLAEAVRRLASDARLRARLREGGRRTAERHTERAYNEAIEAALGRVAAR